MNIRAWADTLPNEFYKWGSINAYPKVPAPYIDVLESIQSMTTPSTMHLLNLAVRQMAPNECYMEVGTWRGSTLIGALLGNEAHGVAIDDDSMDEHDEDERESHGVWNENMARFRMVDRTSYIDCAVPEVFERMRRPLLTPRPVGVYLFDGDKSTSEAAYAGLVGAVPFLANEALIFVDDANEITIRLAVHQFVTTYPQNTFTILDIPTPANCWPCFWNGIMALAWRG